MNRFSRMAAHSAMTAFAIAVVILATLLPLTLKAQTTYGSIVGDVTDSTGAVVPGASVTITNMGTGLAQKAQSDASGKYSVADLLPARYKVVVEKTNFKRTEREAVPVQVGAVVRIDVTLTIGSANETVTVTSGAPLLQTDSSSLNQEVEGDVVQQMPLNGRNVMNLVELAPGVIPAGSSSGGTGFDQTGGARTAGGVGWNNYEIGGAFQGWSADYIDGVPNQLLGYNIVALIPTQDAIQEFSVVSSDATADFGRFAGGVVNMSTKSGANAFHASAWEYLRNTDFNANTWFSNYNGLARSVWNQNQFGVLASGPIKRNKAFFVFTWENFKAIFTQSNTLTVPTQAMQNGTVNHPITDPLGNCNILNNGNGTYTITNLWGPGLKSGTCGDPLNEVLKQFWPLPNVSGNGYNWIHNVSMSNTQTQYNSRVDYILSQKQRMFGRYTWWHLTDSPDPVFGNVGSPAVGSTTPTTWPTAAPAAHYYTQQGVLGDTYTLNSNTVADLRVSYTRQLYGSPAGKSNVNEAQFDQYNPSKNYTALAAMMQPGVATVPDIQTGGSDNIYALGAITNFNFTWYNTYSVNGNLVKIIGAHSLKAGFEARLMDDSTTPYGKGTGGYYTYNTHFSGDEWANFLMGYPEGNSAANFLRYQATAAYSYYQGYYLMDDWQVNRKLTLNLGLRYELPGSMAERHNKLAVLLPNALDPNTGVTGTEALVNSSLYGHRTAVVEQYNLFAPRVGFAYRATNNTVVRGGYGLTYIPNDLSGPNGQGTMAVNSPFVSSLTQKAVATGGAPTPLQNILGCWAGTVTGATCTGIGIAQSGLIAPSPVPASNFMTTYASSTSYKGQSITAPVPYQSYGYVQQWNAALSHQFKNDLMAEVSYSGMKANNLPTIGNPPRTSFSVDELASKYYSQGYTALSATSTAATGCANAPALVGQISVGQCLRPNPYYADMEDTARWTSRQSYKSMQITAEKRFGSNGVLKANYGWSKNMSNTDTANQQIENTAAPRTGAGSPGLQDYNSPGAEYSLIGYNVPNRIVVDYELNLPFGKGQKYANSLNGIANAAASGWAINGITVFQSGFPIFIQEANSNFLTSSMGAGQLRSNVVPGCNKKASGGSQTRVLAGAWFNTACFVLPTSSSDPTGQVTFGNEPRVDPDLHADGIKNFDFAFQKSTPIWERSSFVFRAEFFNIMNRVQFNPPVNTRGSSNFGAIIHQANNPRQIQLSARINF